MKAIYKKYILNLIFLASNFAGATTEHWRQWNVYDGLAETWSQTALHSSGDLIYVSHGSATPNASILNGFSVECFTRQHPYNPFYGFSDNYAITFGKHDTINDPFYYLQKIQFDRSQDTQAWFDYDSSSTDLRYSPLYRHPSGPILYLSTNKLSALNITNGTNTVLITSEEAQIGAFTDMVTSPKGNLWIGGTKGLVNVCVLNIQPGGVNVSERLYYPNDRTCSQFIHMTSYGEDWVLGCYEDNERSLLLEWKGGRWETLTETEPFQGLKGWRDSKNTLWKYDKVNGLFHVTEEGEEISFQSESFLSGEINDFSVGKHEDFWLATDNGVIRHAELLWQPPEELFNNRLICHSILEDDLGNIWFACKDILLKYNRGEWTRYLLPDNKEIYQSTTSPLAKSPDGNIILFTDEDSFFEFDPDNEAFHFFTMSDDEGYFFMKQVSDGRILVLGNIKNEKVRIQKIVDRSLKFDHDIDLTELPSDYKIQSIYLRDYFVAEDGNEYLATLSGVFRKNSDSIQKVGPMESAMSSVFRNDGSIWFGYYKGIVSKTNDRWTTVREPMNYVRSIIEANDGSMWAATKDGVSRYYRDSWIDYTHEDGLPNTPVNIVFEDSWNRIWVGTNNGIYVFHSEADTDSPDTLLSPDQNINEISPSGNLQILYSGVDCWKYTHSERLLYSHRLDRGDWNSFTHGTIFMASGVSFGDHVFEIRSMDVAGNIDRTPAVFQFKVMHPWYRNEIIQIIAGLGIVIIVWLIERWYKAIVKLRTYATTDGLTKLYNRRYFWDQTRKEWERFTRYGGDLSLIIADIDYFKSINDQYGHQNGDRVLETVSKIIAQSIRSLDIAGRIGGEEFAILLPGTSSENAALIAERIRSAVSKKTTQIGNVTIFVTISLGIATRTDDINNLDEFFSSADAALYKAKETGRNRLEIQESV